MKRTIRLVSVLLLSALVCFGCRKDENGEPVKPPKLPNAKPTASKLLIPINNEVLRFPIFSWQASTDADANDKVKYFFYLSDVDKLADEDLELLESDYTQTTYELNKGLLAGTYRWQVVATDGKDNVASEIFTFKVKPSNTFTIDKKEISVEVGKNATVNITSGNGTYTLKSSDENIAIATEKDGVITITAKAKGTATIMVTDKAIKLTQKITITVTDSGENNNGTYPQDQKVFVKGGTFMMGSPDGEGYSRERPQHQVTVSDFYIGKYEVTNAQYVEFLNAKGTTKGQYEGNKVTWCHLREIEQVNGVFKVKEGKENCPIRKVTWYGAKAYAEWVGGRLPTEAEWEYASRGGNQSKGYIYSGSNNVDDVAWYGSNSGSATHQVGTKQANKLGIYDMSGNVWEWCNDDWHESYTNAPTDGSSWGDGSGGDRVLRGGSYYGDAKDCRVAVRGISGPGGSSFINGFRVVFLP